MLTISQHKGLLMGQVKPGQKGRLAMARRSDPSPAQRRFLDDLRNIEPAIEEPPPPHPADRLPPARPVDHLSDDNKAFLAGLPADAAEIDYQSARRLLMLQKDAQGTAEGASYVDHRADAVRLHHDRIAAAVEVRNAEGTPVTPIPASAIPAMADAVRHELPVLTEGEALDRAGAAVAKIGAARLAAHRTRIIKAHTRADKLAAQTARTH